MSEFRFFAFTDYEFYNRSLNFFQLPITPFQPTKKTTADEISHELNVPYTVFEILVAICAIIGNLMVIIVFQRERKLRRRTNYYIVSLAIADFLVGSLGVPFAILASIGLPTNLHACLFTVSLLVVLCTISIFCLVAVSVDRYWAILYPMAYSRNVRTKTAIVIISMCWVAGTVVGFLPLFGWHAAVDDNQACLFVEVMDYNYLVFLYFATIITPALLMLAFYAHIYKVIIKQVRQIVTMNPVGDSSRRSSIAQITNPGRSCHGGTMLRVLGAARKRDVKATQNLSVIVLFFMICWIPLYTINCIKAFCPSCSIHPKLTLFCIILSHLNSAVNPVLYAYHLKDFRLALKNLILKILGIEIDQTLETQHRYSLASQHRLQSMDVGMRNPMQTRIYIDSPIWLRQQQQSLKSAQHVPKCGVVTPCLNNIHQTVAAVASVTTDIEREMWNIMEASSGAEIGEINYIFPDEKDSAVPTPPPRHHRKSQNKKESCESPFSYDNCSYTPSLGDNDFEEVFLPSRHQEGGVDHNALNQSLIACTMRDKLRSDIDDRPPSTPNSQSDYEIPKNEDSKTHTLIHNIKSKTKTPPLTPKRNQQIKPKEMQKHLHMSNSNGCLSNSSIFVIETDTNPMSPGHKPKFRKSTEEAKTANLNSKMLRRSCSCTSDTSASTSPQRGLKLSRHSTVTNSSTSSSPHLTASNQNISLTSEQLPNSYNNNNLNYYTFHHPSSHYHRNQHHHEKFSPLRAMSNLIFPPIVKHSSLFQLFHPTTSETTQTSNITKHQTTDNHKNNITSTQEANAVSESETTLNTEIIDTPSVQV
ncbi:Adenosine receptor A2a [Lucilia cuprina]|nr:Adenosine receptor A2a [Lucilia cuprina]